MWLHPERYDRRFSMHAPGYASDQLAIGSPEIVVDHAAAHRTGATVSGPSALTPHAATSHNPAVTIGNRIRALRRARGLTQDTLAVSTGVSRSAVAQWETGRAGQISGKLRRIAEALGVSVSMLKEGWEGLATDSVLSAQEMSLLRLFRRCADEDRAVLVHVAQKLAAGPAMEDDRAS
jgi:transcriptional regulator with XRE-family HTH domain